MSYDKVTDEIVEMLKEYRYVGVWANYFPVFCVDRHTPIEHIDYLVKRYKVGETEYLLDGVNDICQGL